MRRAASLAAVLLAVRPAFAETLAPAIAPDRETDVVPASVRADPPPAATDPILASVPTPPGAAPPAGVLPAPDTLRVPLRRWFVIPVVSYLPETGFGGGASAGLHLPREGAPRPASFFMTALYTTEGQGLFDLATEVGFSGGAVVAARARALSYPDRFFGIGPDTPTSARERFTRRSLDLVASAELPLFGVRGLRAGPRLDLRAEQIDDLAPGGALAEGEVTGADGSAGAAAGLAITWDRREGTFWPRRGSMAQAFYVLAPAALSRTGAYGRGVLELRHFAPLGGGLVLGLHGYGEAVTGTPPFTIFPRIGSTRMLRGIREGRYRDRVGWTVQSELRAPVWRRISAVVFGAMGDVAPGLDALRLDGAKVAGGMGLRYRLTDEGANLRADVAVSRFGVQFYLLVLEAF